MAGLANQTVNALHTAQKFHNFFSTLNSQENTEKVINVLMFFLVINTLRHLRNSKKIDTVTNLGCCVVLQKAKIGFKHRTFDEENATYQEQNKTLQSNIGNLKEENEVLQSNIGDLEGQIALVTQNLKEQTTQLETSKKNLKKQETQLEQLTTFKAEFAGLSEQDIKDRKLLMADQKQAIEDQKQLIASQKQSLQTLKSQVALLKATVKVLEEAAKHHRETAEKHRETAEKHRETAEKHRISAEHVTSQAQKNLEFLTSLIAKLSRNSDQPNPELLREVRIVKGYMEDTLHRVGSTI